MKGSVIQTFVPSVDQNNYSCILLLKVPYHKKQIFSALYIYKLVLPEPANSQKEENKGVLHGLCSPPTGNTVLLQAVQILLLSLHNERRDNSVVAQS